MRVRKIIPVLLAGLVLLTPPQYLYATEINIDLKGEGRLEYDQTSDGPDVVIESKDLQRLRDSVINLEKQYKIAIYNSLVADGIDFDLSKNPVTNNTHTKNWYQKETQLTFHKLIEGLDLLSDTVGGVRQKPSDTYEWLLTGHYAWIDNKFVTGNLQYLRNDEIVADTVTLDENNHHVITIPDHRYTKNNKIDGEDLYQAGYSDGLAEELNFALQYYYHQHDEQTTEKLTTTPQSTPTDTHEAEQSGGCFTKPKYYSHHHSTSTTTDDWNAYFDVNNPNKGSLEDWYESTSNGGCFTKYKPYYHHHKTSGTYSDSSDNWYTNQSGNISEGEKDSSGGCFTKQHHWYHWHSTSGSVPTDLHEDTKGGADDNHTQATSGGCFTQEIPHRHIGSEGESPNGCYQHYAGKKTVKKRCTGTLRKQTSESSGHVPGRPYHHFVCDKCGGGACWCEQGSDDWDSAKEGPCTANVKVKVDWYVLDCNKPNDGYRKSCPKSKETSYKETYSKTCGWYENQLTHERWTRTCNKTNGQLMYTKYIRTCGHTAGQLLKAILDWHA